MRGAFDVKKASPYSICGSVGYIYDNQTEVDKGHARAGIQLVLKP